MDLDRPDLTGASPEIVAYIEALESALTRRRTTAIEASASAPEIMETSEPPSPWCLITLSRSGLLKRTARHLYDRQRRGGMGVFDIDLPADDQPEYLLSGEPETNLFFITSLGRVFPIRLDQFEERPIHAKGEPLHKRLPLQPGERIAALFGEQSDGYLSLVTERGQVRRFRHHYFSRTLQPGTLLYDVREGGAPAATAWTAGTGDLFVVTRKGNGIRFSELQVPVRGCLGIRVDPDDMVVGVAGVSDATGVLLVGDDGRGTIRLMSGFGPNKSPGGGGKVAIKTDRLIGAAAVKPEDDVLIISRLGKIIRFRADEIPPKEGVVQGVNCIALRSDEAVTLTVVSFSP